MSTQDRYVVPVEMRTWDIPASGAARFSWEYDDDRESLLRLYQKGKDKQWDAMHRIDWDLDIDPHDPLGMPPMANPIAGSRTWEKIKDDEKAVGELRAAPDGVAVQPVPARRAGRDGLRGRIVESVPDLDSKFYAGTQTMDEARHAEAYARFLQEKVGLLYPINPHLKALLDDTLSDSPLGHAVPGDAGADRGSRTGGVRRAAGHDDGRAAQADPRLRHAGRGPARRVRTVGAAGPLRPADRGGAGRARGLRASRAAT